MFANVRFKTLKFHVHVFKPVYLRFRNVNVSMFESVDFQLCKRQRALTVNMDAVFNSFFQKLRVYRTKGRTTAKTGSFQTVFCI